MNRLNHKLRKARGEVLYLRGLVKRRNGGMREDIDPSVDEKYANTKDEIRHLVAIIVAIRKGYKKEIE